MITSKPHTRTHACTHARTHTYIYIKQDRNLAFQIGYEEVRPGLHLYFRGRCPSKGTNLKEGTDEESLEHLQGRANHLEFKAQEKNHGNERKVIWEQITMSVWGLGD